MKLQNLRKCFLKEGHFKFWYITVGGRMDNNKIKTKTVSVMEFMELFVQHFLPKYFMKIRNYGILFSRSKTSDLAKARKSLKCEAPGAKKNLP